MATQNPFDTNTRANLQRAGSFQTSSAPTPRANKYQPLIDSVNRVAQDEGMRLATQSADDLMAHGAAQIASNDAQISDLKSNKHTTQAQIRGAQVMTAKRETSNVVTKFHEALEDPEMQRMSSSDMTSYIHKLIADTNTGDIAVDNMIKGQLGTQAGSLADRHMKVHRARVEDDVYREGYALVNSGIRQISATQDLDNDTRISMIKSVYSDANEYMLTEDQQRALLSATLVTSLETGNTDAYNSLKPNVDRLGGLSEAQTNRVNQAHAQAERRIASQTSFDDVVAIAELEQSVNNMNDMDFYDNVKDAHESGLITPTRSEKLIKARQEAQFRETTLVQAGADLINGNSVRAEMLSSDDQQAALAKGYLQLQETLIGRGLEGEALQSAMQGAWTSILISNPNLVEQQTSDRLSASASTIQSGQFTDDDVNNLRLAYEFHKNNPALLAGYVKTKDAQATILNYGKLSHLSADSLMNMVQKDRRATAQPNLTPAQSGEINTLTTEYRAELEGRESGWLPWNWGAQDPDNIAAAGYIDLVNDLAARNLRSGMYVDADASFEAAKVEAQTGTEQVLGYTVPTGQISISNRLLTSINPEFAINKYVESIAPKEKLAKGEKIFLDFDTTERATLSIIKRHADGFTETLNTTSLLEIGRYAEDNKSGWDEAIAEFERDRLVNAGTRATRRKNARQAMSGFGGGLVPQ
jgi:hypothetical protein